MNNNVRFYRITRGLEDNVLEDIEDGTIIGISTLVRL